MKTLTLGEKIRQRRKALGMTQAALAGDLITRNMISRLESDDIRPSFETLLYLTERLDVPAGYLLTENDDLADFLRPKVLAEARRLYRQGKWQEVVALCTQYGYDDAEADDETGLLLCECAVRIGREAYTEGDVSAANMWFDRALTYAERTVYHTEVPLGEAVLCKAMLAEMTGASPAPYLDAYAGSLGRAVDVERFLLLRFFYEMEHGDPNRAGTAASGVLTLQLQNELYRTLIAVWKHAAAGDILAARDLLASVFSGTSTDILAADPILTYRCVVKMEQLAAETDDYKTAYQFAARRQQMERKYHIR